MAQLSLQHLQKVYDNNVHVVKDFTLEIADKEFIVFVGPSGCGKSTTLRMIAGLEEITHGELYIGGVRMNDVPAKSRDIAMVFQNYALYPHMSVYDNMAFGLKMQKIAPAVISERVEWAAQILGLPQAQAGRAVRRAAPAGGARQGDCPGSRGIFDGRTPVESGRQTAGADARRDRQAASKAQYHHDLRHPRSDRSHDHGDADCDP